MHTAFEGTAGTLVEVGQQGLAVAHEDVELYAGGCLRARAQISTCLAGGLGTSWSARQPGRVPSINLQRKTSSTVHSAARSSPPRLPVGSDSQPFVGATWRGTSYMRLLIDHWFVPFAHSDLGHPILGTHHGNVQGIPGTGQQPAGALGCTRAPPFLQPTA